MKTIIVIFAFLFFYNMQNITAQQPLDIGPWPVLDTSYLTLDYSFALEHYDHGYLELGNINQGCFDNMPFSGLMSKYSINGELLWRKVLYSELERSVAMGASYNGQGEIFVSATIDWFNSNHSLPVIAKLNPCGEKVWCKIFDLPGYYPFGLQNFAKSDGGCIFFINDPIQNASFESYAIYSLNSDGDVEWVSYFPNDKMGNMSRFIDYSINDIVDLGNDGFIAAGSTTNYQDSQKAFWVKLSSDGEIEWQKVLYLNGNNSCEVLKVIYDEYSNVFYSVGRGSGSTYPIIKLSFTGDSLDYWTFTNDSTILRIYSLCLSSKNKLYYVGNQKISTYNS